MRSVSGFPGNTPSFLDAYSSEEILNDPVILYEESNTKCPSLCFTIMPQGCCMQMMKKI